jgi:aminoglycoside phosphotransferase (APT) family kinase protein
VALRSRNRLYRLRLAGAIEQQLILKVVRQEGDRFWEHHLRREYWLLELLARFWPGGAPRPFAMAAGQGWGVLVAEDVGATSLAEQVRCSRLDSGLLRSILEKLAELHAVLRAQQPIFYRVCRSIELDRVTAQSLRARAVVAGERWRAGVRQGPDRLAPGSVLQAYAEQVARPLTRAPRQMIHNSLSPLNVVLGPAPRFVDWETMAYAAPEFDLADLLRYPDIDLTWPAIDALATGVFGRSIDPERLRLAALARAVDYAGVNAQQAERSRRDGDEGHAQTAEGRRDWYRAEADTLAGDLGLTWVLQALLGD